MQENQRIPTYIATTEEQQLTPEEEEENVQAAFLAKLPPMFRKGKIAPAQISTLDKHIPQWREAATVRRGGKKVIEFGGEAWLQGLIEWWEKEYRKPNSYSGEGGEGLSAEQEKEKALARMVQRLHYKLKKGTLTKKVQDILDQRFVPQKEKERLNT